MATAIHGPRGCCVLTSGPPPVTYVLGTPAPAADCVELPNGPLERAASAHLTAMADLRVSGACCAAPG